MLENDIKPEIEVFDLAMLYNAANLVKKGLLKDPPHVQFVMGIPNAMPARRSIFDFLRSEIEGGAARRHLGRRRRRPRASGRSTSGASRPAATAARASRTT